MNKNDIQFYILSLLRPDRKQLVEENVKKFPEIKIVKSINGYDAKETLEALEVSGLKYHWLGFPTYGTLANFLTKYNILKYQIANKIDFMCFIEDDLELHDNFMVFIQDSLHLLKDDLQLNMLRLDTWGEGYVTSLEGARRIKYYIDNQGIRRNIDNQLRLLCGKEKHIKNTPWRLKHKPSHGDCLKTERLPKEYKGEDHTKYMPH
jgi:hypothetical protein